MRLPRSSSLLVLAALALSVAPSPAVAQPRQAVGGVGLVGPRSDADRHATSMPFKEMFGVPVASRLIQSDDPVERIRGIERLGTLGTTEAIDALVEQIEQGSPASRDPRARLMAVRVLAAYTSRDN